MPRLHSLGNVAQRFRHPNGTLSEPFIAPMSKARMLAFAVKVLEGYWPRPADQYPEHERDDLGTCRIEGVFGGQFARTLLLWGKHGDYPAMLNVRREMPHANLEVLSYGDLLIALLELGGGGGAHTYRLMGGVDVCGAIARTTIQWAKSIEEWS